MMSGIVQYENKFKTEEELIEQRNQIVTNLKKLISRFKHNLYIKQEYFKDEWLLQISLYE